MLEDGDMSMYNLFYWDCMLQSIDLSKVLPWGNMCERSGFGFLCERSGFRFLRQNRTLDVGAVSFVRCILIKVLYNDIILVIMSINVYKTYLALLSRHNASASTGISKL